MAGFMDDAEVIQRVLEHAAAKTTDLGDSVWREPLENYRSEERFFEEMELFRRLPLVFCPSAAMPDTGSYVARTLAGAPLIAVRSEDGLVRAFHTACRHRGMMIAQGEGNARSCLEPDGVRV